MAISSLEEFKKWYKIGNRAFKTGHQVFLRKMNELANELGMEHTQFSNAHGCGKRNTTSTIEDLKSLCQAALKSSFFREVIKTRFYTTSFKRNKSFETITWETSNKILINNPYCEARWGPTVDNLIFYS